MLISGLHEIGEFLEFSCHQNYIFQFYFLILFSSCIILENKIIFILSEKIRQGIKRYGYVRKHIIGEREVRLCEGREAWDQP